MDLFDLFAKITLDTGEYEQGVDAAAGAGRGLAQQLRAEIVSATSRAESSMGSLGTRAGQTGDDFDGAGDDVNDLGDDLRDAGDDARRAGDDLDDAGDSAGGAGDEFDGFSTKTIALGTALGNLAAGAIQLVIGKLKEMISMVWDADETTREYREGMGKLETAFQMAGYGSDIARSAFQSMYHILGDNDTATEASQLLAQLAENEQQISEWGTIAAGVIGTFGDSLPIEGLIESANETAKVGAVTGSLADALNWVGISEDAFNDKLEACADTSARTTLITDTLREQYSAAAAALEANNAEVLTYNDRQLAMQDSMANLGETVGEVKSAFMDKLAPAIGKAADKLAEWIGKIDVDAIFEKINTIVENFQFGWEMISKIWGAAVDFFSEVGEGIKAVFDGIGEFFSNAFQEVNDALTEVFNGFPGFCAGVWEEIRGLTIGAWEDITTWLSEKLQSLSQTISNIWNSITNFFSSTFETISSIFTGAWNGIRTTVSTVVETVKTTVSTAFNTVKTSIATAVEAAYTKVSSTFENIKTAISDKIGYARDVVGRAIEKIKGFFNFSWSLPPLKLPHISVSGSFSLNPPSVPTFGISWYKRAMNNPMFLNGATIFGMAANGTLLGGGEAGQEVVIGVNKLMSMMRQAVSDGVVYDYSAILQAHHGYTSPRYSEIAIADRFVNRIISSVDELSQKMDNLKIYLDTGVMVGEMSSGINRTLGKVYSKDRRLVLEDGLG